MKPANCPLHTRFEEFLPLRGRWLRYFVTGGWILVLAVWWCIGGHDGWARFSTVFSADPRYIDCKLTFWWGFFCGGGMSLAGHTAMRLQLGPCEVTWLARDFAHSQLEPWELTWLAPDFAHSQLELAVRVGLNLASAVVAIGLLVHGKLRAMLYVVEILVGASGLPHPGEQRCDPPGPRPHPF